MSLSIRIDISVLKYFRNFNASGTQNAIGGLPSFE